MSAASAEDSITARDIAQAEAAMREAGQVPLFTLRGSQPALDGLLEQAGYSLIDPTNLYLAPVEAIARPTPRVSTFTIWEPLAIQRDIWAAGGIGPARVDVMMRVTGPKTSILGRHKDQPAATAFVAIHDGVAMVHALEVMPCHQRQGVGSLMMHQAASWAAAQGAKYISTLCVQTNTGSNGLMQALGMECAGQYHYRRKEPS